MNVIQETYEISYLKKYCAKQIRSVSDVPHQTALNYLSKSLLYESFTALCKQNGISNQNPVFDYENIQRDELVPYLIANQGFVFSEYILQDLLKITPDESVSLKKRLDSSTPEDRNGGNIFYSDLYRVKNGLNDVIEGSQIRVMADWPFRFYSRLEKEETIQFMRRKQIISFFYFDSGYVMEPKYFKKKSNIVCYMIKLIELYLEYDNVLLYAKMKNSQFLVVLKKYFEVYEVNWIGHYPYEDVFLIPTKKENPLHNDHYRFILDH